MCLPRTGTATSPRPTTGSSHPPTPRSGSGPRGPGPTGRRSLLASPRSVDRFQDPVFRQGFARTVTHYWGNGRFLGGDGGSAAERDGVVLRDAHRLKGSPGTLVQGSLDVGNLLGTVWRLRRAWPGREPVIVDDAGHTVGAPGVAEALVAAADADAPRRWPAGRS